MRNYNHCPVCFDRLNGCRTDPSRGIFHFDCPRCGRYRATEECVGDVLEHTEEGRPNYPVPGPRQSEKRAELSAWLQEHPDTMLMTENVQELLTRLARPPVLELADRALLELDRESRRPGQEIDLNTPRMRGLLRVWNREGVDGWIQLLEELGYVRSGQRTMGPDAPIPVAIAARGWERLHELRETNPDSPQGFVAMWFDDSMARIYDEAFAPAIEGAGYRPHRVDRREFIGRVDDEIVAQIRRSRFVVADFTGHRGGVYWEAGLAEGFGLPVIFTCQRDHLDELHFDVRQNNTIVWTEDNLDELQERLRTRIEAVLGRGPSRPTAITALGGTGGAAGHHAS